nr:MAG TPA: hypothetical protein [Caudoviricetes sp.]
MFYFSSLHWFWYKIGGLKQLPQIAFLRHTFDCKQQ